MYLRKIVLQDWKLYGGDNVFEFPEPGARKKVVLVGAKNGYGKTSLLEAIVLGLYGKDGLDIVARADGSGDDARRRGSYRQFLESAWHKQARTDGRSSMCVELEFVDKEDGSRFAIRRTWTFSAEAKLLASGGEEVQIFLDGVRKQPPRNEEEEDFVRAQVTRYLLPSHLAPFFLFDGERVQALARKDMAAQVRLGIEGFLGVRLMRDLADDMRSFVRIHRGEAQGAGDGQLGELVESIETAETRLAEIAKRRADLQAEVAAAARESEELQGRLSSLGGGSVQDVKRLTEDRARAEKSRDRHQAELAELVGGDLAFALSGPTLRSRLRDRIGAEQKLARWQSGMESSKGQVDRFATALASSEPKFAPALTAEQQDQLTGKIRAAWVSLWHPPAEGCAPSFRHDSLSELDRARLIEHLGRIENLGASHLATLLEAVNRDEIEIAKLTARINEFDGIGGELDAVTTKLKAAVDRRSVADAEDKGLGREQIALEATHRDKRAELERSRLRHEEALPAIRRADIAEKIANMVAPFIEEAVSACVEDIAERMTEAFKEMAHKSVVDKIRISPACEVQMLSRHEEDLRGLDQSAGENQVFAFALISAIARAADVRFPLIIDTPLARLDQRHREQVLRHFTDKVGDQIILLSQDTEVVEKNFRAVESRIATTFLIENDARPGSKTGRARVLPAQYFPSAS